MTTGNELKPCHDRIVSAAPVVQAERAEYPGVRCMCILTGCRAGPGCPHYSGHCKAHIAHVQAGALNAAPVAGDIVVRLRAIAGKNDIYGQHEPLELEAAAEIERLRGVASTL